MTPVAKVETPDLPEDASFDTAEAAVERLQFLYSGASQYLCDRFGEVMTKGRPAGRIRAFYPEIRIATNTFAAADTRLASGMWSNRAGIRPQSRGPISSITT